MNRTRHTSIYFIILYILIHTACVVLLPEGQYAQELIGNILLIIAPLVSSIWLIRTYRAIADRSRNVWLILSIGTMAAVGSNIIFTLYEVILFKPTPYPSLADSFLIIQYFMFLSAILLQLYPLNQSVRLYRLLFNVLIMITVTATLNWGHISRSVQRSNEDSLLDYSLSFYYAFMVIGIAFAAASLFFAAYYLSSRITMFLLAFGMAGQVIADLIYMNETTQGTYITGNSFSDPLWSLSWLLIGFAAIRLKHQPPAKPVDRTKMKVQSFDFVVSYISILVLLTYNIVTHNQGMGAIEIGLLVTMLLVIMRQVAILRENHHLVSQLHHLNEQLETKVEQRTADLNQALSKMEQMANQDPLTELPNRSSFSKQLQLELERAERLNYQLAVLFIDLDRFKLINDTLGHDTGDLLLRDVARRLVGAVRRQDLVARLGGDEFTVILPEMKEHECASAAQRIITALSEPFTMKGQHIYVTPSIGISLYPCNGSPVHELLQKADAAMYYAKQRRNTFEFYTAELQDTQYHRAVMEQDLRKALEKDQFVLHYQPLVDIASGRVAGVEALIRWKHHDLGLVSPAQFIDIAEESGLILPIGEWVLRTACKQNKAWQDAGLPHIYVSVNVAARQLVDKPFVQLVHDILKETGLKPGCLQIEITENSMQNVEESRTIINTLKSIGVQCSIDDFGRGYSSLYYLKNLPIDNLKIDQTFTVDILENDGRMVRTIIDMGHNLNLKVVAEGVENEEQAAFLKKNNCQLGQGYYYSEPKPAAEFEKYWRST